MVTEADIEIRLSGGSTNSSVALSLGGAVSNKVLQRQTGRGLRDLPGVTYRDGSANPVGRGSLAYVAAAAGLTFTWTPNGKTAGPARPITVNGRYAIRGPGGEFIVVDVIGQRLPADDVTDTLLIANPRNILFDDLAASSSPVPTYRCQYVYNQHPTISVGINSRLVSQGGMLTYGVDPAEAGTEAQVIPNETTAPEGVVFDTVGLALGAIGPRQGRAIWWRRNPLSGGAGEVSASLQLVF